MGERENDGQHGWFKSVLLHLLPGAVITLVYVLLLGPVSRGGYPSLMALMLAVLMALVPCELGYLFAAGYRKNRRLSLKGVIAYRNRIPLWNYLVWVPALFVAIGAVFTALKPLDQLLHDALFSWMPALQSGLTAGYGKTALIITYAAVAVLGVVVGPVVEELYFRGYLLPRMKFAGKYALVLHSFLFALYHFFTPWMLVTRTVGMIPLAFGVRKKNLNVGIIVHILINSIDVLMGVVFIAGMGAAVAG